MFAEPTINDPAKAREFFHNRLMFTTGPVELARRIERGDNIVVVDVRAEEDYNKGHIPHAINLPKDKWDTLEGLRKDALNVLYCYSVVCHLASTAAFEFADKGYPVMELEGGFDEWKEHKMKIEKPKRALAQAA